MSRRRTVLALAFMASFAATGMAQSVNVRQPGTPGGANEPATSSSAPGTSALPTPFPSAPSTPNFPNRLGDNVGWRIQPSPGVMPGTPGINRSGSLPGVQPLPITPQPSPARTTDPRMHPFGSYRDINNPGGASGPFPGWANSDGPGIVPWDPDGGRQFRHPGDPKRDQRRYPPTAYQPTYYLLPYYIPYVVETRPADPGTPPAPFPNQPTTQPGIAAQPLYPTLPQPGPYGSVSSSSGASLSGTATSNLTLLVFKDRTIVLVKAYWLEGDTIWYETPEGSRSPISIAQLDLTLTQQLNKDRGIKFILESK